MSTQNGSQLGSPNSTESPPLPQHIASIEKLSIVIKNLVKECADETGLEQEQIKEQVYRRIGSKYLEIPQEGVKNKDLVFTRPELQDYLNITRTKTYSPIKKQEARQFTPNDDTNYATKRLTADDFNIMRAKLSRLIRESANKAAGKVVKINYVNFFTDVVLKDGISLSGWPAHIPLRNAGQMTRKEILDLLQGFDGPNPTIKFYQLSKEELEEKRRKFEKREQREFVPVEFNYRKRKGVSMASYRNLKKGKHVGTEQEDSFTRQKTASTRSSSTPSAVADISYTAYRRNEYAHSPPDVTLAENERADSTQDLIPDFSVLLGSSAYNISASCMGNYTDGFDLSNHNFGTTPATAIHHDGNVKLLDVEPEIWNFHHSFNEPPGDHSASTSQYETTRNDTHRYQFNPFGLGPEPRQGLDSLESIMGL